ncbi:MAG TPA: pentapeptide repeat-containing protein [Ktedonobacteraceae bacterium]|nr:pentapeptide repeat-containing protein [Ktedonobacteraceae bacterium]
MKKQTCSAMVGQQVCGRGLANGQTSCPVHAAPIEHRDTSENTVLIPLTQKELDYRLRNRELSNLSYYDLSGLSLAGVDLAGKHFVQTKLNGADLSKANLRECLFSHAQLQGTKLEAADLEGTYFLQSDLQKADFSEANLTAAFFNAADLREAVFQDARLIGCRILKTNASQADFARADLHTSIIEESYFVEADFQKADLQKGSLLGCDLRDANLIAADLERTDLRQAILKGCKLLLTNFDRTKLSRRSLSGFFYEEAQGQLMNTWEIYDTLKANFDGIGRYGDARWAYIQERRYKRKTFAPWYAWKYYADDETPRTEIPWVQWWWHQRVKPFWFFPKYTFLWLASWIADGVSGFGELPSHVIAWGVLVVAIFALIFNASGLLVATIPPSSSLPQYIEALIYSISTFLTMSLNTIHTAQDSIVGDVLSTIEGGLGMAWFGLLLFTLGNRISKS